MADRGPCDPARDLREVNGRLLLAGLRQQELAEETERERRQEATLLESVGVGIIGFDAARRCTSINRAATQMLDAAPGTALGRDVHGLMHAGCSEGPSPSAPACPLTRVLGSEPGIRIDDGMLWRRDGTCFPATYSAYPIIAEGRAQGGVVAFSDITEWKRAEEAMLEAAQTEHRLEGVKLAVREVAHLLNNDLALAVGTLDLLQNDPRLSSEALEGLHTALAALDTAAQHMAKFQRIVRVETRETPSGLSLDVERSISSTMLSRSDTLHHGGAGIGALLHVRRDCS